MGTTEYALPRILDLDQHFSRTPNTIVFNDLLLDKSVEEVLESLCDISSDRSDSVAVCECGELSGNYYEGVKCQACGSICEQSLFGLIRNDSWLEIPKSIKGVLNPQAFRVLSNWLGTINKFPVLRSVLDMSLPVESIPGTPFFIGMGFNWFYDNFDAFMTYFINAHPNKAKRDTGELIDRFIKITGKAMWCTKLPILSKILQPIAKVSDSVRYADVDIKNLITAIFTLGSILLADKVMKFSADHVERNFYKVYMEFIEYTKTILTNKLPRKPSILRKHVFGSRYHCTGRSVAVPIIEPHEGDEVYLPWKLGIMMWKYHILSMLVSRYNLPVFAAYDKIMNAINIYDHDIDKIMQTLISECPYKGLPILMNRNPSLSIAAIQLLFVTRIKPNLVDNPFPAIIEDDRSDDFSPISLSWGDEDDNSDMMMGDIKAAMSDDMTRIAETVVMSIEDSTIEVSPLIIKGPLNRDGAVRT